jgi:hypothetical protein
MAGEGGWGQLSMGERWVSAQLARTRRRVRAARVFISSEAAGAPIYL